MAENLVARDMMLTSFKHIAEDQSLADALSALLEVASDPERATVLVVVHGDGSYAGLLTSRLFLRSLLALWMPGKDVRRDEERLTRELLGVVGDRLGIRVGDTMIRGLPTVGPDERLGRLIEKACDAQMEFLPVLEGRRAIGLVPVNGIFHAAASFALTPKHRGIDLQDRG
jgi:CBS domain-containing protein